MDSKVSSGQLNRKRTFAFLCLWIWREESQDQEGSMDSPFLLYVTHRGSQTYKSSFYSEELTVQYLKRKSLGKTAYYSLLPHAFFVRVGLQRRGGQQTLSLLQSRLRGARSSRLGAISLWSPWSWRRAVSSILLPPTEGTAPKWGW